MPLRIRNHIVYPKVTLDVVPIVRLRTKPPKWTPDHDEIVKARYLKDGASALAQKLGRGRHSIQTRACYLGVTGVKGRSNG